MPSRTASNSRLAYLFTSLAVIGLALWVRLDNLYGLPVFIDESNHLAWAQSFARNSPAYPFLMDGKFLLGVLLAQFQVVGGSPLWQARAGLALVSLLSCAAGIALGRQLGSRKTGLLAGLLYALLPYAIFHERQVLADPLMAHFGAILLVLTPRLARHKGMRYVPVLAALLASAFLSKLTAVVYLIPLLMAALLLPSRPGDRRRLVVRGAFVLGLTGLIVFAALAGLAQQLGYNDSSLANQQIGFVGCPALLCHGNLTEQLDNMRQAGVIAVSFVPIYFGWPLIALACLAWPAGPSRARRRAAFLSLSAGAMLLAFFLAARSAPPRYYSFLAVPLTALAAGGLTATTSGRLSLAWAPPGLRSLALALLAALAFQTAVHVGPIVFSPAQASLPEIDHWQYISGPPSGAGIDQAARNYLAKPAAPPLIIAKLTFTNALAAYLDLSQEKMLTWQDDWAPDVARALLAGRTVYVVEQVPRQTPASSEPLPSLTTALLASYSRLDGTELVRVRQVTGADSDARSRFFEALCARPAAMTADYQALARYLAGQSADGVLLAYPPNQSAYLAGALARQPQVTVLPIGDSWPLDTTGTTRALQQATAGQAPVRAALSLEGACDPTRFVETWLATHLFRLEQQWFGPLRLVEYAPAAPATQALSPNAAFDDSINLERVELIDSAVPAGGVARLRLVWHATAPVSQTLKVFVHLFNDEGIVAQHDGVPQGELLPTSAWSANSTVLDQFAIRVPPEAAPGPYRVRIGLYNPDNQARTPVKLADGTQAEFYVGGTITVVPAH